MLYQQIVKSLIVTLSLCSVVFLSACSESSSKKSEQVIGDDLGEYKLASCKYGFREGSAALARRHKIVSTHFGKKINMGHLESVLKASASEVVRFGQTLGVTFYKTSVYESKNCEFLAPLPWAPSDLDGRFTEGSESTLGLYLQRRSPDLPSTNQRAAILVRRDANKWVLVHEFMHHLFQMQVATQHGDRDIKDELLKAFKEIQDHESGLKVFSPRSERFNWELKKASRTMVKINNFAVDFVKEYLLEEMTIETILGKKFDDNEISQVVAGQRLNGAAYILGSGDKAIEFLISITEMSSDFIRKYSSYLNDNEQSAILNSVLVFKSLKDEIDRLQSSSRQYIRSRGYEIRGLHMIWGLTSGHPDNEFSHVGCSREHDADEVLASVRSLL